MKSEQYRAGIREIQEKLNQENQVYFKSFYDEMLSRGSFKYDESEMLETIYNLLLDLFDAQCGGQTALSYFGVSAEDLAKTLLKKLAKISPRELRRVIWFIGISVTFWIYFASINWFSSAPLGMSWLVYVLGGITYLLGAVCLFKYMIKLYTMKNSMLSNLIGVAYVCVFIIILVLIDIYFKRVQVIYIPSLPAKLAGVCFAILYALLAYRLLKDDEKA